MQTLKLFSALAILLLLVQCSSEGGTTDPNSTTVTEVEKTNLEKLMAKWKIDVWLQNNENRLPPGEATWTFNPDKTFALSVAGGGDVQTGKWTATEQDTITIIFDEDPEFIKAKFSIENYRLIINGEIGDEMSYKTPYRAELEPITGK